ncbi:hypothetical protein DdX_16894 [Ditylenchus destructor]|uniref:Uncharacterized protein n=1 Tax=Ditylenchus destructor TaxID=166010 RepID=A0AAD4MSU6_9BILA|nr:hypothetical protein DdX_16894 [Ditylenchus destructor]
MANKHFDISNVYAQFKGVQNITPLGIDYQGVDESTIAALYIDKELFGSSTWNTESTRVNRFKKKGDTKYSHSIDLGTYATGKNILNQVRCGIIGGIPNAVLAIKPNGKGLDLIHDDLNVYKTKDLEFYSIRFVLFVVA